MVCCENQEIYEQLKLQNGQGSDKEIRLVEGNLDMKDSQLKAPLPQPEPTIKFDTSELDFSSKLNTISQNKQSLTEMLIYSNNYPMKPDLGSKSYNSIRLKNMGGFKTPEQISIPMSIPIKLISVDFPEIEALKELYKEIDQC